MAISRHELIREADKLRYAGHYALKVREGLSDDNTSGFQMKLPYCVFMTGGPPFDNGYRLSNFANCLKVTQQKHVVRQVTEVYRRVHGRPEYALLG